MIGIICQFLSFTMKDERSTITDLITEKSATKSHLLLRKEVIHPQLPLRMPCYDFTPIIDLTLFRLMSAFGYYRLSWCDGRCVQNPRTYSPRHGWFAVTSDSSFMRASCSPQSELRPILVRFAPPFDIASHCTDHCSTCVAQGIRAMLIWRHPYLPPR